MNERQEVVKVLMDIKEIFLGIVIDSLSTNRKMMEAVKKTKEASKYKDILEPILLKKINDFCFHSEHTLNILDEMISEINNAISFLA